MDFKKAGATLQKNTKTKAWWLKVFVALILSNIFFFILFKSESPIPTQSSVEPGWVELQMRAELLTPYHTQKKILLINRGSRSKVLGYLRNPADSEGRVTILIHEENASLLFKHESWEILPYMEKLSFAPATNGENYEIRY